MEKDLSKIIIQPDNYLITRLPDYFKAKKGKFDTRTTKSDEFHVGIIESVGDRIDKEQVGKVIYYLKGIADVIEIKGIGEYELLTKEHMLVVRMDQDKDNY